MDRWNPWDEWEATFDTTWETLRERFADRHQVDRYDVADALCELGLFEETTGDCTYPPEICQAYADALNEDIADELMEAACA